MPLISVSIEFIQISYPLLTEYPLLLEFKLIYISMSELVQLFEQLVSD